MNEASVIRKIAPFWHAVLFFLGLALVYLGQRVLPNPVWLGLTLTGTGGLLALVSSGLRLSAALSERERSMRSPGWWLTAVQLIGLAGLSLYFASSDWGIERLGIDDTDLADDVRSVLQVVWIVAISVSCLGLLFGELALHPMRGAERLEAGRVGMAITSGIVLGLAASYGSLLVFAASRAEKQADYSYFKTSEPGESTRKLVQQLGEQVRVTAFFPPVNEVRKEVERYFNELVRETNNLEFTVADRYLNPKLARDLKVTQDGQLVIAKGESTRTLTLGTDIKKARNKLKSIDKDFNEELFKLLRSSRLAYLTVGHGELNDPNRMGDKAEGRSSRAVKKLLEQQNYRTKDLGLSQGLASEVPDDAGLVLVLGPTAAFAPEEIASLQRYAERGGKLLMALDTDGVVTSDLLTAEDMAEPAGGVAVGRDTPVGVVTPEPGASDEASAAVAKHRWLVELAGAVGAEFSPTRVADQTQFVPRRRNESDHAILITNKFSSHASVSTLNRNSSRAAVIFAGAGHLDERKEAGVRVDVTVRTFPTAFVDVDGDFVQGKGESSATYSLALALSRPVDGTPKSALSKAQDAESPSAGGDATGKAEGATETETEPDEMRAFVLADADVISDLFMANFPYNQLLMIDAIRWLGGEESIAGELETEEDVRLEHTKDKDLLWFYSTIFGVPLLVLAAGLVLSRRLRGARA